MGWKQSRKESPKIKPPFLEVLEVLNGFKQVQQLNLEKQIVTEASKTNQNQYTLG